MNKGLHTLVLAPTQQIAEMPLQILSAAPPPPSNNPKKRQESSLQVSKTVKSPSQF